MPTPLERDTELRHRNPKIDDDHEPKLRGSGPLGYECVCGSNLSWLPKRRSN